MPGRLRIEPMHKSYATSATSGHDKVATDHLLFVVWPLVLGYSGKTAYRNREPSALLRSTTRTRL